MKIDSRILVATDVVADADLVRRLLREEFKGVVCSTEPARAVADFEAHRPSVLILAFDALEKAERYYLSLYRLGSAIHSLAHRTLILCGKDDLHRVYALCNTSYFDDYVLFWPLNHDAQRLPMAVHHALKSLAADGAGAPTAGEFAAHARRLADTESVLDEFAVQSREEIDAARGTLRAARTEIGQALDRFSHDLTHGGLGGRVEVKDSRVLQREIDRLKSVEVDQRMDAAAAALQPACDRVGALKGRLAPQLESANVLTALAKRLRPVVLLVDDEEFQHRLVSRLLQGTEFDLECATSGASGFAVLRKSRPDLVLMDVQLPDMDGIEATRRIKATARFERIPVLIVTGRSDKEAVVQSAQAGASGFVVKPFDKEILLGKIRACLPGGQAASPAR